MPPGCCSSGGAACATSENPVSGPECNTNAPCDNNKGIAEQGMLRQCSSDACCQGATDPSISASTGSCCKGEAVADACCNNVPKGKGGVSRASCGEGHDENGACKSSCGPAADSRECCGRTEELKPTAKSCCPKQEMTTKALCGDTAPVSTSSCSKRNTAEVPTCGDAKGLQIGNSSSKCQKTSGEASCCSNDASTPEAKTCGTKSPAQTKAGSCCASEMEQSGKTVESSCDVSQSNTCSSKGPSKGPSKCGTAGTTTEELKTDSCCGTQKTSSGKAASACCSTSHPHTCSRKGPSTCGTAGTATKVAKEGSCCGTQKRLSGKAASSCCSTSQPDTCSTKVQSTCGTAGTTTEYSKTGSCCGTQTQPSEKTTASCCSSSQPKACSTKKSAKSCCTPAPQPSSTGCCSGETCTPSDKCSETATNTTTCAAPCSSRKAFQEKARHHDEEKGGKRTNIQLQVDGMTCTSCSNKFEKGLKELPGISNIKVNFVMGTAEFDLDDETRTDAVMREMERKTGLGCARINSDAQHIDLRLPDKRAIRSFPEVFPRGVLEVEALDGRTVRVSYDPLLIGARSVVDYFSNIGADLAPPASDSHLQNGQKKLWDMSFKTLLAALLTIPVCVLTWGNINIGVQPKYISLLILATGVQAIAVPEFYRPAFASLFRSRQVEMDMLVVISISAAYFYSVVAFAYIIVGNPLETDPYFETSTLLITLVLLGRLVAAYTRLRAVSAVSLRSLQAQSAMLLENGETREIDARLLQYGDRFVVMPHSRVPTDGRITEGSSEVDESMLTGEALPVVKKPGMDVVAGTTNYAGRLVVQLTRLPGKNTLVDIARLVDEASASKPRAQDLADKVASWFVLAIGCIATIVFLTWFLVSYIKQGNEAYEAAVDAIGYTIAVLAISCPCAIGLAVPMVLAIAGGVAARKGVVIKSGQSLAASERVTDVVFDKTGTLTTGELTVAREEIVGTDPDRGRLLALALARDNVHPISIAITKHLSSTTLSPALALNDVKAVPGAGIIARAEGHDVKAGNAYWTSTSEHPSVAPLLLQGLSVLCITEDSHLKAVYGLTTHLRPEAVSVLSELRRRGLTPHVVSGDHTRAVTAVADTLGISAESAVGRQDPSQKRAYVAALTSQGKTVLFVGDGANDAAAVAQASIGAQLSSTSSTSSDLTRATADVVLLGGLEGVLALLDVGRAAGRRVRFNFAWAAIYNLVAILLASGALVKARVEPEFAGLGEMVSVLPVILAAVSMVWMLRK